MKKSLFFSLIFFLFFLYYFFFPLDGGREIIWTPSMVQDLSLAEGKSFPLLREPEMIHNGSFTGLLMPGSPSVIRPAKGYKQNYSLSHSFTTNDGETSILMNRINKSSTSFHIPGSPMIFHNHFLITGESGTMIREVSSGGEILWSWDGVSPVTALAASDMFVAFGILDGQIHLFRKDGAQVHLESANPIDDSVVYGLALSDDASFLVAVLGLEQQDLLLYRQSSPLVYTRIARFPLLSHYDRPVKMAVSRDGSSVWVEQPGNLLLFDEEGIIQELDIDGHLLQMLPDEEHRMVFTAESYGGRNLIKARSYTGEPLFSERAKGGVSLFNNTGSSLSLVLDNKYILYQREIY